MRHPRWTLSEAATGVATEEAVTALPWKATTESAATLPWRTLSRPRSPSVPVPTRHSASAESTATTLPWRTLSKPTTKSTTAKSATATLPLQ